MNNWIIDVLAFAKLHPIGFVLVSSTYFQAFLYLTNAVVSLFIIPDLNIVTGILELNFQIELLQFYHGWDVVYVSEDDEDDEEDEEIEEYVLTDDDLTEFTNISKFKLGSGIFGNICPPFAIASILYWYFKITAFG